MHSVTTNYVVFYYHEEDPDVKLGLAYLWESLKDKGIAVWYGFNDIDSLIGMTPCDIYMINTCPPNETLILLKHLGFNLIFIGNKYSVPLTFITSLLFDIVMIDNNSHLSAIMFAYYVYLKHADMGNRLDFLPIKLVSDDLSFIYNNKINELISCNLVSGVYITGINGPVLKQNIGSALSLNDAMAWRLNNLNMCKGYLYV